MIEKTPTVRIEMYNLPNLILEKSEYESMGKFKGFLKDFQISILEIKKVHHILMCPNKYPTCEWEG